MSRPSATDVALATTLAALANPVRLAILRELRTPRALGEIRVLSDEEGAERPLSRQAVRQHLDRLLEVGAVGRMELGANHAYVVEHRKLFSASEDLRSLAALRPLDEPPTSNTETMGSNGMGSPRHGPRLVLVRGLGEGTIYPLDDARDAWTIGRRRELEIALDYDPFVSSENAIVRRAKDGGHTLEDTGSRNGTLHNFNRVPHDAPVKLRHGDVIGVGHTTLLYWTD